MGEYMTLKEGIVYKTRSGKRVKIVAVKLPSSNGYTCAGIVFDFNGKAWTMMQYRDNGQAIVFTNVPDPLDIVGYWVPLKSVKKESVDRGPFDPSVI